MKPSTQVIQIISSNKWRMGVLRLVQDLALPDCWVGAGFVRNAVWDRLHDKPMTPMNDIDVVYFDPERTDPVIDDNLELELGSRAPRKRWSVRNQARMHLRNGEPPYASTIDAIRHWPETATAVAVSLTPERGIEVIAPHGLDDLVNLIVRPTSSAKAAVSAERARVKRWGKLWPRLRFEPATET